jgi:hypothetical protein
MPSSPFDGLAQRIGRLSKEVSVMLGTSIHAPGMAMPALASRKAVRSAVLIGALLLAAVAVNVLIVVADIKAHAVSQASADGAAACQARDRTPPPQHPFRGALAPFATCAAPHV